MTSSGWPIDSPTLWLALGGLLLISLAGLALWLLRRPRPRPAAGPVVPTIITVDCVTFVIYIRRGVANLRRLGRVVAVKLGSYAIKQGNRLIGSLISYDVSDEMVMQAGIDLDTQQARLVVTSAPPTMGSLMIGPAEPKDESGAVIQTASGTGFGLSHKPRAVVQRMKHRWLRPLQELLQQLKLELQLLHITAVALYVIFFSPGGHAEVGREGIKIIRQQSPRDANSVLLGVTVVPGQADDRVQFAEFARDVVADGNLDFLLLTRNRPGEVADPRHDDMVAHLLPAILQDAKRTGANPANVLADSTIARTAHASSGSQPTRILSFEYIDERVAVIPPPVATAPGRQKHSPQGLPRTSAQVLVDKADEIAFRLTQREGEQAGPLPVAADSYTAIVLGLPCNDPASFAAAVTAFKTQFAAREIDDPRRKHLIVARMSFTATVGNQGVPLVGMRLGEIGTIDDLVQALEAPVSHPPTRPPASNGATKGEPKTETPVEGGADGATSQV